MTTHVTFMEGLFDWIVLVAGFDADNVFRRNQNNPDRAPSVQWATYKEIGGTTKDYALWKKTENAGAPTEQFDMTRIKDGTTIISMNIYSEDGADVLRNLFESREEREPRKLLKAAGGVLIDMSGPRDLSLLSDTNWKQRYQADFTFNTFTKRVETDYILDVSDINGEMIGSDGTVYETQIYVDRNG